MLRRSLRGSGTSALHSARLRGGFLASPLPRGRPLSPTPRPPSQPLTTSGPGLLTNSSGTSTPLVDTTSEMAAINSIVRLCESIHEQGKSFDHRLLSIEQRQTTLSDALKELHTMMKKQMKESFAIKGSSFEASENNTTAN